MTSTFPGGSETVFTYGAPLLKFGTGASDEIGYDLSQYGARRVLVVTDSGIAATGLPARVAEPMRRFDIEAHVYDGVHVEPTDASLQAAIDHATEHGPWDAYVAVGDDAEYLPAALVRLMRDVGIPNGIGGVGYDEGDVGDLVEGTMKQRRLLDTAPRPVTEDDAAAILTGSLANW
jgi:alcohol dehydrogenase class IV